MLPAKFRFIWPNGFREESKKSANQKQESPVVAIFVTDRDGISNLYRGSSIDASYQVSDHLAKQFKDNSCLNIDICIQNAVISIQISELNYRYMPLKPLSQMN
jgi:hypothetical protein